MPNSRDRFKVTGTYRQTESERKEDPNTTAHATWPVSPTSTSLTVSKLTPSCTYAHHLITCHNHSPHAAWHCGSPLSGAVVDIAKRKKANDESQLMSYHNQAEGLDA
jgi:hypothetical protein